LDILTRKLGPLPGWAWGAIGVILFGLIIYMRRKGAAASGTSSSATPPGYLAPDQQTGVVSALQAAIAGLAANQGSAGQNTGAGATGAPGSGTALGSAFRQLLSVTDIYNAKGLGVPIYQQTSAGVFKLVDPSAIFPGSGFNSTNPFNSLFVMDTMGAGPAPTASTGGPPSTPAGAPAATGSSLPGTPLVGGSPAGSYSGTALPVGSGTKTAAPGYA
jgi:hypothetical protein